MKQIALYSVIIISMIMLTGCSNQMEKLNCTKTIPSYENIQLQEAFHITFRGNKVSKIFIYTEYEISDNYVNVVDDLTAVLEQQYAHLEEKKGIELKTSSTDTMLSVTINADIKKMDSTAKDALGIDSIYQSIKDVKKELEREGYTCE